MDFDLFDLNVLACTEHLAEELSQIRTGRAAPELLYSVKVEAYGTVNPIKNIANITVSDARSLLVQPWDKSLIQDVNKALSTSDLSVSTSIEGDHIRVKLPDMTEERRKEFVKIMKDRVETARVAVRNVRQKAMKDLDDELKAGASEDGIKRDREYVEQQIKDANEKIEAMREAKETDLMSI